MNIDSHKSTKRNMMFGYRLKNKEKKKVKERKRIITSACSAFNFPPLFCVSFLSLECNLERYSSSLVSLHVLPLPLYLPSHLSVFASLSAALKCNVLSMFMTAFLPCAELWPRPNAERLLITGECVAAHACDHQLPRFATSNYTR